VGRSVETHCNNDKLPYLHSIQLSPNSMVVALPVSNTAAPDTAVDSSSSAGARVRATQGGRAQSPDTPARSGPHLMTVFRRTVKVDEWLASNPWLLKRVRPWYLLAMRLVRQARYWGGWRRMVTNVARVLVLTAHLALMLVLAKVLLWPTSDPREEWWPAYWGVPWSTSSKSWAVVAAEQKAELVNRGLPPIQPRIVNQPLPTLRPPRLPYPVLWAAPFFSRSGARLSA
jgi:hypothetical protein